MIWRREEKWELGPQVVNVLTSSMCKTGGELNARN